MTRFKKAICNDAFENWEIADIFQYVGDLGYDGVELNPYILCKTLEGLSSAERVSIREAAESAGVEIIGIHSILKSPKSFFYLNHPDASIRADTVEHLKALITLCGDLGGRIIPLGASKH